MKFVFDLDGTICFDGMSMPKAIRQVLLQAGDFGHDLIFASARSYRDCLGILGAEFRDHLVIGLNGGLAYQKGQLIFQKTLSTVVLDQALALCDTHDLPYFLDNAFDYAYQHGTRVPFFHQVDPLKLAKSYAVQQLKNPIKMVMVFDEQDDLAKKCQDELNRLQSSAIFYHEGEQCLYLNPSETTKGATVEQLCGPDFVAFGNDKNDMEFFERASYAVQVGDYKPLSSLANTSVVAEPEAVSQVIHQHFVMFGGS